MTIPQRFRRYARVLFAASAMILATVTAEADVYYVTQGGGGSKNGTSWTNAYDEAAFPAAIISAGAGDEIWVRAGVYRPSTTNDATKSFVLKNGVAVYGGFAGTETSSADRDPAANVTVLTGDLANDDAGKVGGVTVSADQIQGTNSTCVVTTSSGCGATTILDGFTITAGNNSNNGGGMYLENSSPTVTNCAFSGNRTSERGAGVATSNSNAVFEDCRFSGNSATYGGGMFGKGSDSTLRRCAFLENYASDSGGGIALVDGSAAAVSDCTFTGNTADYGGGMYNDGSDPTVTNCTFSGNSADDGSSGGGGGMYNYESSPDVTNCAFSGNNGYAGGGMWNHMLSRPTVTNCTFSDNAANTSGGGMYNYASGPVVRNCAFSGNSAAGYAGGGMMNYQDGGDNPIVMDCSFSDNTAPYGGGVCNDSGGNSTVTGCTFSDNDASDGGGMYNNNSDPTVTNCTFSGNSAAFDGGGMANSTSSPAVTGCTFSENTADGGGGMYNLDGAQAVTNCTFSGNSAANGGGMYNGGGSGAPVVWNCTFSGNSASSAGSGMCNVGSDPTVTNCIVWGNTGGQNIENNMSAPAVTYSVVQGVPLYAGVGNINIDPLLGPLAYNGGSTQTHALPAGSPAIGAANPAVAPETDQRGVSRDVTPDIGAYEYWEKQILTVTTIGNGSATPSPLGVVVGTTGTCWGYDNGKSVMLTASEDARSVFVSWGGDASGTSLTTTVTMDDTKNVEASFDVAWLVTVSAGPGGDIAASAPGAGSAGRFAPGVRGASGTTTVKARNGADKTFTVTPNAGYSIGSVRVDGTVDLGTVSTYTFTNVSADHAIEATFTANPTPTVTPSPTAAPTDAPAPTTRPTSTPTPTATPVPTPDPRIPLPTVTLKITLYAGGTVVAGPIDITDPATLSALLSSPTLLAQLLATDPGSILSGQYNMDLVRFFSLIADLDDGTLDFTILFEVTVEGVPAGYRAQVFVLTRTFDSKGNPTGYSLVPRNEGANVFRKGRGATGWTETWRVTVRDGGVTDGDAKQDGSVAPQIAAVVAVFPMATPTVTATPTQGSTGSGGGCSIPANGSAVIAAILLLAPVVLMRRR